MAIPLVIILGFACTFYIYVAVRWWNAAMIAKQEGKRASALVRLFASVPEDGARADLFRSKRGSSADLGIGQTVHENRGVIVMSRARVGK
jgi:hypothetical protein